MLEHEYQYYKDHEAELVRQYTGKFIGIVGDQVVGSYGTEIEGYIDLKKRYGLGNFLLQQAVPDGESQTQRYYSRVAFQ